MSKLITYVNEKLANFGWSYNELARRAELSSASISHVMTERRNPGFDFCVGIARALGEPPEKMLRLAGLLPALPPAVENERELVNLFRGLSDQARDVIIETMRNLLGKPRPVAYPAIGEEQVPYKLTVAELWNAIAELTPEERGELLELLADCGDQ